ncbi:MAG: hypothetical protein JST11_07365 [Acidobacteria bacterium]|nr:hypothetical protein [Acidobacteriota bacterium]
MRRLGSFLLIFCAAASARHGGQDCGTTRETPAERVFLHRQSVRAARARAAALAAPAATPNDRDTGNIAIIEDSGGVVARLNQFNLDHSTLTFTPASAGAASYRFAVSAGTWDSTAAAQGSPLVALGDDDARQVTLPFAFPFFGASYNTVWINSDGNLTFTAPEYASSARLTGRVTGGPPRIAPLFDDLDPSQTAGGVRAYSGASAFVVSWVAVPEWTLYGIGQAQTFQVALYPDGRIAFTYSGATPGSAVVGIAPGFARGATNVIDFATATPAEYPSAMVERFGNTQEVDIVLAAQRFYQNHDDAYDYLVVYNNSDIPAMSGGTIAYESTVRSSGSGWGVAREDYGTQYGSASRLRSVMNMGFLRQYPLDTSAYVGSRAAQHDTPLTILGHEAGHLFLANASIPDPDDPTAKPMLGYGGVHWSFVFNSEASLDEGEQILDNGAGQSPRFTTAQITQHYSPLDQYLMGFRPGSDVPDTFLVTGYDPRAVQPTSHQLTGISFNGSRLNVTVNDIVQAEGRRTPDSTVAQRHYRFGFILVVPAGSQVSASDLQQVESYRQQFVDFYARAADGNASAETTLNRGLQLSLYPAAGVLAGAGTTATLTLAAPAASDLAIRLDTPKGVLQAPASVVIPKGAASTSFTLTGVRSGVEEFSATPADSAWETARARVQVADATVARLTVADRSSGSVTVRLSDGNDLPYPGARILAAASGGSVSPAAAVTDAAGLAVFHWDPAGAASAQLRLSAEAAPAIALTVNSGSAAPSIAAVVNAASYTAGVAPGSIATIFGANLDPAARVTVNGAPAQVFYASSSQINFYVPAGTATGTATVAALLPSGAAPSMDVAVVAVSPGIFGIVPAPGVVVIYATGLGPTRQSGNYTVTALTPQVFFGATPASAEDVLYSGVAPGFLGLYQVNVLIPAGVSGTVPVVLAAGNGASNAVQVTIP